MDNQECFRLQQEINYWSNMISSHKNSASTSKHHFQNKCHRSPKKYVWNNNSNRQPIEKHVSTKRSYCRTKQKVQAPPMQEQQCLSRNLSTTAKVMPLTASPNKIYSWKNPQSASQAEIHKSRVVPNLKQRRRSSVQSDTSQKAETNIPSSNLKAKDKDLGKNSSIYKWRKHDSLSNPFKANSPISIKKLSAVKNISVASLSGKYRYRRRRKSTETLTPNKSVSKSLKIRKLILGKYKLLQRSHVLRSPVNTSRNPYKVIKRPFSNANTRPSPTWVRNRRNRTKYSTSFAENFQPFPKRSFRKRKEVYKSRSDSYRQHMSGGRTAESGNRFKYVRRSVQTRSRSSGNIVLKRKQQPSSNLTLRSSSSMRFPTVKQRLASSVVHRSLGTARSKNRHKLKKVHCIFYNRFGKCNRGDKCPYVHDPERVAICTQFLRGTCRKENCPFSHKTSLTKMPVCSFFLRGNCSTKNCPYLHVFHGRNARVCRTFVKTGFCSKAQECKDIHIRACPDFYETGKCDGNCNLPHRRKHTKTCGSETSHQSKGDGFISLLPPSISQKDNASKPGTGT